MDWTALHFFDFNLERVLHCSFSISHIFSRNGCPLIIFSHNSSCTVLQRFFTPLYNLLNTSSSSIKRIEGYCFGSHSVNQYRNSSILFAVRSLSSLIMSNCFHWLSLLVIPSMNYGSIS